MRNKMRLNKTVQLSATFLLAAVFSVNSMAASVLVEGEKFTAEGGGSVTKTSGRPATSGGVTTVGWNDAGHWMEWKFDVAEAGDYKVFLRYAGGRGWTVYREVKINGAVPAPAFAKVALPVTGGFGRKADEWSNFPVSAEGKPVTVKLEKGAHTIRINNLGGTDAADPSKGGDGGANLDALILTSGDTTVESALKL